MDALRGFLEALKRHGLDRGHARGLLYLLIARHIFQADGTPVSRGLTWRQLAAALKKLRWNKERVRELGLNPADLPPRDRVHFWYTAISLAKLDSPEARQAAEILAGLLPAAGYRVQ